MITTKRYLNLIAFTLLAFSINYSIKAQIMKDPSALKLIKSGVDCIYNFQFNQARNIYMEIKQSYPEHPIPYIFRALITYWENYPLLPDSPARQSFEDDLYTCIELSEKDFSPVNEAEYLMTNLGARGLLLLFYADNGISMQVLSIAPSTYKYVKKAFDNADVYEDFYFITGLYNYYREAYPEAHPVYKPLAFIFPKGDKARGLRELDIAARQGIFLKAEAFSFLSGIYISFENNYPQAFHYSKTLHELYPSNVQYLAVYIKNLLLVKRYDEAEELINKAEKEFQNNYFDAQLNILRGILLEKKYSNLLLARRYYLNGISSTVPYGVYASEFNAYAYFGLSRISAANKDNRMAKNYRKKAEGEAAYDNVNFDN